MPKRLNCFICNKQFIWSEDLRKFCSIDCKKIHKINQRKKFYHSDKFKEWRKNYSKLDKVKESVKKYQQSEKYQKYLKEYQSSEKVKKLNKERSLIWQKANKDKIEAYRKTEKYKVGRKKTLSKYAKSPKIKKVRERYYKTPKGENAKLWSSIRVRLKQWCGTENVSPRSEMGTIVGCSKKQLRTYLENKFKPGMNWQNHGKWHIDHIKPLSKFNPNDYEDIKKANHYTNLQPLWATENIKKSNK